MMFINSRRLSKAGVFFLVWIASIAVAKEHLLRNESLAQTEQGRQLLKYLVGCALPEADSVFITIDEKKYTFQGNLGWVPGWVDRPMTDAEKRKMSACIAAHTNFFGKTVQISLRSDDLAAPKGFQTTATERKDYSFFEAGFFGNLFVENPVSYVCLGNDSAERDKHLESLYRVCSLEHKNVKGFSRCNFKIVGHCKDKPFMQEGVDYSREVLQVYLPAPSQNNLK